MYLGACGAINTIPISPMAPVWASHGLLTATCPARGGPNIPSPSALTRFSPRGGGHQDKQSMPMTDPRQTEHNYGNSVLRDTVSLKPSVSTLTTPDCCCLCMLWGVCLCVCVGAWLSSWTSVSTVSPHNFFCVIAPEVADWICKGAEMWTWKIHERQHFFWAHAWLMEASNARDSRNLRAKLLKVLT